MAIEDRQNKIVTLMDQLGFMTVKDLSKTFQVSEMTIRRDLDNLAGERRLRRTYGARLH